MSARPGNWHLLGRGRDPVPGEPTEVQQLADGYESTAADVERLAGQLRRLSHLDGWEGQAAEKFADAAEDLSGDLAKAEGRYRDLAAAVRGWVEPLTAARAESMAALNDAVGADEDLRRHGQDLLAGIPEPTPAQLAAQDQQEAAHTAAATRLRQAQHRLDAALDRLDDAARRTAERIHRAAEKDGDSVWDDMKGWVRDHADLLKKIATVLGRIAIVLAAITLVVAICFAVPALLLWAGVAASGLLFATQGAMLWAGVDGVSRVDVALDLVGLVTAGVGGALAKSLSRGIPLLTESIANGLGDAARLGQRGVEKAAADYFRAGAASRIGNAANNLRRWGQEFIDGVEQRVADAGAREAARIRAGVVKNAPWAQRLKALDKELAVHLLELRRLGAESLSPALRQSVESLARKAAWAQTLNGIGAGALTADGTDQLSQKFHGPAFLQWKEPLADALPGVWALARGW